VENKINGFHNISRKYFIDILTRIKNKNIKVREQFNKILKKNNGDYTNTSKEFENDFTVKKLIDELNKEHPNWHIKKDILEEILRKIERIKPEELNSFNQIRDTILKVLDEAKINDRTHYNIPDKVVLEICNEEKKKFFYYINNISEEDLTNTMPIFYRSVLSKSTIKEIKENQLHLI